MVCDPLVQYLLSAFKFLSLPVQFLQKPPGMRNINILVHFWYYWSAFSISFAIDTKSILCILQEFNQNQNNHPVITTKNLGHENVKMFKSASVNDQYVLMKSENSKSYTNRSSEYQNVVICIYPKN